MLGYSYYSHQAKWALEIIEPDNPGLNRIENLRVDFHVPEIFRTDHVDYIGSGYDSEHLVTSAKARQNYKTVDKHPVESSRIIPDFPLEI